MNSLKFVGFFLVILAVANAQCPHASMRGGLEGERTYKMVTTTTISPVTSSSSSSSSYRSKVNVADHEMIRSVMRMMRHNGNIAPKIFIRYFQAKPQAQKMFPAFATVPLKDLPRNGAFLSNAYTCMAAMFYYAQNTGTVDPSTCSYLAKSMHKYEPKDIEMMNSIILSVMDEELGSSFSLDAKKALSRGLDIMMDIVTKH